MAKQPMNKKEALATLYYEFTARRRSKAALKRLRRACEALGLNEEETAHAEYLADYRAYPSDEVYTAFVEESKARAGR
jgi:hypothetical protein